MSHLEACTDVSSKKFLCVCTIMMVMMMVMISDVDDSDDLKCWWWGWWWQKIEMKTFFWFLASPCLCLVSIMLSQSLPREDLILWTSPCKYRYIDQAIFKQTAEKQQNPSNILYTNTHRRKDRDTETNLFMDKSLAQWLPGQPGHDSPGQPGGASVSSDLEIRLW